MSDERPSKLYTVKVWEKSDPEKNYDTFHILVEDRVTAARIGLLFGKAYRNKKSSEMESEATPVKLEKGKKGLLDPNSIMYVPVAAYERSE